MIEKLVFFNTWHFGDVHSSKEFVKSVAKQLGDRSIEIVYVNNLDERTMNISSCKHDIFSNYQNIIANPISYYDEHSKTFYWNTWIGHHDLDRKHNYLLQIPMWKSIAEIFYQATGIQITFDDDPLNYISEIEEDSVFKFDIPEGRNVLVCNSPALSNQTIAGNLVDFVDMASNEYKDLNFICTDMNGLQKPNIFFTDEITNKKTTGCDLLEIGYLAQFCEMIITKSSGPGTFATNKKTLMDKNKTFIGLTLFETDLPWYGLNILAKTRWTTASYDNIIFDIFKECVK